MKNKISAEIAAKNGIIYTDIYPTAKYNNTPLIIFVHGFKGFKDWGGFPYMMQRFAEAGFTAASFNMTHNGVSNDAPMDFTRLDLFAENTHSIELENVQAVINYFYENAERYNIDKSRIALVGHSRGGGAAILAAANDERIKAIVTLAAIAKVDRYTDEQKKRWREKGFIEMPNARTGQLMRMNKIFLDDIEHNKDKLDITAAASRLKIPALFIHGKEDLAVKASDAEKIYEASNKDITKLHIIESTGHTFGVEHPFKGSTNAFDGAIGETIAYLNRKL